MPERLSGLLRRARSWQWDTILAVVLGLVSIGYEVAAGATDGAGWVTPLLVVACVATIALRRRWPVLAAAVAGLVLVGIGLAGQSNAVDGPANLFIWVPFVLAYGLGANAGIVPGLLCVALLAAGLPSNSGFNPLGVMITLGPWLAGRAVRSRRRLSARIEDRNRELQAERARFAAESIRCERARIARELHDIVAHCLSVVVVQAGAGQRLVTASATDSAAEVFATISDAAGQALTEMGRLVDAVAAGGAADRPVVESIDQLVRRAESSGLTVRLNRDGPVEQMPPAVSEVVYRVVQESLTNAIKHAPGAVVDVTIREAGERVEIDVVTGGRTSSASGLENAGGGQGLAGMSARVAAISGIFSAGPTSEGGWRIHAELPVNEPIPAS